MRLFYTFLFAIFGFKSFCQDTIIVHIAHGSKPRSGYNDEFRTIGGKKGGHVVIQVDQFTYGFYFTGKRIHIFPHKKHKNGVFQKQTLQEWTDVTKYKKVTKVFIPVTKEEKITLLTFYSENLKRPTYDYAFFGQRCASSAYNQLKSINKIQEGSYFFNAFYPGQLRKQLIKQAYSNNYRITVKEGSKKRIWEGD